MQVISVWCHFMWATGTSCTHLVNGEIWPEIFVTFQVKCVLFSSNFNKVWFPSRDFSNSPEYQISWKSVNWEDESWTLIRHDAANSLCLQSFAKASKNWSHRLYMGHDSYSIWLRVDGGRDRWCEIGRSHCLLEGGWEGFSLKPLQNVPKAQYINYPSGTGQSDSHIANSICYSAVLYVVLC
jgi:hypothetical protein